MNSGTKRPRQGLPEQDAERDPTARSSHEPELPIAEAPDENSDVDGTVGYREFPDNFEDSEDAADEDDADPYQYTFLEDISHNTVASASSALRTYLDEYGTQVEHSRVESLDLQNGGNECWSNV